MGRPFISLAVLAGATFAAAPPAAASAVDLYYERSLMSAADARCGLFAPPLGAALAAAQAQARGAALRSGADATGLDGVAARARAKAGAIGCRSADLATAASRVRQAFDGYAKLSRISYPGDVAGWDADRTLASKPRWRLAQTTRFGFDRMRFGLAAGGGPDQLLAVARFADGRVPYAARLVMRDPARSAKAYLLGGTATARPPLPARLPPPAAARGFAAEARLPVDKALASADLAGGWAFRFPNAAAVALTGLDPREAVAVEFLFAGRGRDEVRRAYVEVGDFAAGQAFLRAAAR